MRWGGYSTGVSKEEAHWALWSHRMKNDQIPETTKCLCGTSIMFEFLECRVSKKIRLDQVLKEIMKRM